MAQPSGEKVDLYKESEVAAGQIRRIPLYDECFSGRVGDTVAPTEICPDEESVCDLKSDVPGTGCTNKRFWVTAIACLRILGPGKLYPIEGHGDVRVIVAEIPCDNEGDPPLECSTPAGWTTGEPAQGGDNRAVSLIE